MDLYLKMRGGVRKRYNTDAKLFMRFDTHKVCSDSWTIYQPSADDLKEVEELFKAHMLTLPAPKAGIELLLEKLNVNPKLDRFEISGACGVVTIVVQNRLRRVTHRLRGDSWDNMVPFDGKKLPADERRKLIRRMFMANISQAEMSRFLGMTPSSISRDVTAMSRGEKP